MQSALSLSGTWDLTWEENNPDYPTAPRLEGHMTLPAAVPAPVHRVLMDAGLLPDVNIGLNTLAARWVEEMYWVYRRTVDAPSEALAGRAWLVFDRLEMNAVVWLNGQEVGRHANAHRPARFEVTGRLAQGPNLLVVRLESGIHDSIDKPSGPYATDWCARLTRRHWDRKPQYQAGWDWNPRLMNVGILGDARLEWSDGPRLDEVTVFAVAADDLASAVLHVRATVDAPAPAALALRARIVETGQEAAVDVAVEAGESRHELAIRVEKPELWWPVGHGPQSLSTVEVTLEGWGEPVRLRRRTGVRRVRIDQSPHPDEGLHCIVEVNNRPIFCRGGNWVPADMLYSEVTPERYRELVDLAVQANFNLLRIWGGGLFADTALCDACDERGVLLWHDFLFACSKYPGDDPEFTAEVRREVVHAVRELARHPSLAVWCGNNEIEWGDWGWQYDGRHPTHPHYALFHHDIPKIVLEEDPSTPHWLSSPWSPDYRYPNDPIVGDQHPWGVSLMDPGGADWWSYRAYVDRFPNEGGVLGASLPVTLRAFLPEGQRRQASPAWQHHDNTFAYMDQQPGELGHAYKTVHLWTGLDPIALEPDRYALLSGLLQADGLREYIANYRRRMFSSASAIFWMYNDSWPVSHGWTIVDYWRRRKLSYHPVRRAFEPVTVVVTEADGEVTVWGVNDSPAAAAGCTVRFGAFGVRGGLAVDRTLRADLPPLAATPLATFAAPDWDGTGAFAVLQGPGPAAQYRLFTRRFHQLGLDPAPQIRVTRASGAATLTCDTFAWGVILDVEGGGDAADNAFDLVPGVPYTVSWPDAAPDPVVVTTGNALLAGDSDLGASA